MRIPMLAACTSVVALAGCGSPARAVRPAAPTYAQATGSESCAIVEGRNQPFVVDWPADRRGEVEAALKTKKVVVVAYDCHTLRLLPDCDVRGEYGFVGTTEREQVLSFSDSSELRANFPVGGALLAGKLGGGMDRGATLDVALATIGRKTSSKRRVLRPELRGECSGATHFVRAATVGAFAMRTGTRGKVVATADLFGGGARAESASTAVVEARDGSLDACRRARVDADAEEAQCGAPLRLELRAITDGAAGSIAEGDDDGLRAACPRGTLPTDDGTCATASSDAPHVCRAEDPTDCDAQCRRGSMVSCAILGRSYELGRGVTKDLAKAVDLLGRACKAKTAPACGRLGELALAANEEDKGLALLQGACADGWVEACTIAGAHVASKKGAKKVDVVALFRRACAGGDPEGCWSMGVLFDEGLGVRKNDAEAARWFEVACDAGARLGCVSLAKMVDEGRGAPADPARAAKLLRGACEHGYPDACGALSTYYFVGKSVARDPEEGASLLDRACQGGDAGSCFLLATRLDTGTGLPRDAERAAAYFTRACAAGIAPACARVQAPSPKASPPPAAR